MSKIHLMNIDSIKLINNKNKIKYEQYNIKNTLHSGGEFFILSAILKDTGIVPVNDSIITYYVGLDNRGAIDSANNLSSISQEPESNNYSRQPVSNWELSQLPTGTWVAKSSPIVFSAISSSGTIGWGPVNNIFLATTRERCAIGCTGVYLISSAKLDQSITLSSGDKVVLEMSLSIFN